MMNRPLVLAGVMTLAALSLLSAKSYDILIDSTTKAGAVQLKPGEYKLKVEGSNAVFEDVTTAKTYSTPIKIQTQAKKYQVTAMDSTKVDGVPTITAIELGGTPNELTFGE